MEFKLSQEDAGRKIPIIGTLRDPRIYIDICEGRYHSYQDKPLVALATQNSIEIYMFEKSTLIHDATIHIQQTITAVKTLQLRVKNVATEFRDVILATTAEKHLMMIAYSSKLGQFISYIVRTFDSGKGFGSESQSIGHQIFIGNRSKTQKDNVIVLQVMEFKLILIQLLDCSEKNLKLLDEGSLEFDATQLFSKPYYWTHGRFSCNDEIHIDCKFIRGKDQVDLTIVSLSQLSPSSYVLREKQLNFKPFISVEKDALIAERNLLISNRRESDITVCLDRWGPAKFHIMKDGSRWILGFSKCIHYQGSMKRHTISTPVKNADILVTVELNNNICLAITTEETAFWVQAVPGWEPKSGIIHLATHDMYPFKAMMISDDCLFVIGRSQCVAYKVSQQSDQLTIQPELFFSGIGPIADMVGRACHDYRVENNLRRLNLACCISSSTNGGSISILSSKIQCITNEYEDTYEGIPTKIWNMEINGIWYVFVLYLDHSIRSFQIDPDISTETNESIDFPPKKNLREKDQRSIDVVKDELEEIFSDEKEDILGLSQLSGDLLTIDQENYHENPIIVAVTDEQIMTQRGMDVNTRKLIDIASKGLIKAYSISSCLDTGSQRNSIMVFEYEKQLELYLFSDFSTVFKKFEISDEFFHETVRPFIQVLLLENVLCIFIASINEKPEIFTTSTASTSDEVEWTPRSIFDSKSEHRVTSVIMKPYVENQLQIFIGYSNGNAELWVVSRDCLVEQDEAPTAELHKTYSTGNFFVHFHELSNDYIAISGDRLFLADKSRRFQEIQDSQQYVPSSVMTSTSRRDIMIFASKEGLRTLHIPSTFRQAYSISRPLRQTPYSITELADGSLATLNRYNIVERISTNLGYSCEDLTTTTYATYVLDNKLRVKQRMRLRRNFEPYAIESFDSNTEFALIGQRNMHIRMNEKERNLWNNKIFQYKQWANTTRKMKLKEAVEDVDIYIEPNELATQGEWEERVVGVVQWFSSNSKNYTFQAEHTRFGGPVLSLSEQASYILVSIGSKFDILSTNDFKKTKGNAFWGKDPTIKTTAQTQTLCVSTDYLNSFVVMGDATRGIIVRHTVDAEFEPQFMRYQYSYWLNTGPITNVKFFVETCELDIMDLVYTEESGMVGILGHDVGMTSYQKESTLAPGTWPMELKLRGKIQLKERINKIVRNNEQSTYWKDTKVWNPVTYSAYKQFFQPTAVLGGNLGGLYQIGWLDIKNWGEGSDSIEQLLKNFQHNMLITYYYHGNWKNLREEESDDEYDDYREGILAPSIQREDTLRASFDQDGKLRTLLLNEIDKYEYLDALDFTDEIFDLKLVKLFLKLDIVSQKKICQGDEYGPLKQCGPYPIVLKTIRRLIQIIE